jgi:hypothetical protein
LVHGEWLDELVTDVHRRHPRFRRATIEKLANRLAARYDDAPVQTFVPVLVLRAVLDQLRYAEKIVPADVPLEHRDPSMARV